MKLELILVFLFFLLASFVVLAEETDFGEKDEDHVKQAEDPRWGRKGRKHKYGGKRNWPWQKKTALEDQQFFDWPWSKRKAIDINQDEGLWPWHDAPSKDEGLWPWHDAPSKDEGLWPWHDAPSKDEGLWPWHDAPSKDEGLWPWHDAPRKDQSSLEKRHWPWQKKTTTLNEKGENLEDGSPQLIS